MQFFQSIPFEYSQLLFESSSSSQPFRSQPFNQFFQSIPFEPDHLAEASPSTSYLVLRAVPVSQTFSPIPNAETSSIRNEKPKNTLIRNTPILFVEIV
jgi:hypothetical protein